MNSFSTIFNRFAGWTGLLVAVILVSGGCSSTSKPASASFAGVIISNHSAQQIRDATDSVFQQNGYRALGEQGGALVYEREATEREQREYAGFAGAHEGEKVNIRVRVKIEANEASSYWLTCKAYAICNPGQPVFETTTALFGFQSGPYQKLLDKIKGTVALPAGKP
ncbi:MAG: hypothetical protein WDM80_11025 [Limisphaerales bacterium]